MKSNTDDLTFSNSETDSFKNPEEIEPPSSSPEISEKLAKSKNPKKKAKIKQLNKLTEIKVDQSPEFQLDHQCLKNNDLLFSQKERKKLSKDILEKFKLANSSKSTKDLAHSVAFDRDTQNPLQVELPKNQHGISEVPKGTCKREAFLNGLRSKITKKIEKLEANFDSASQKENLNKSDLRKTGKESGIKEQEKEKEKTPKRNEMSKELLDSKYNCRRIGEGTELKREFYLEDTDQKMMKKDFTRNEESFDIESENYDEEKHIRKIKKEREMKMVAKETEKLENLSEKLGDLENPGIILSRKNIGSRYLKNLGADSGSYKGFFKVENKVQVSDSKKVNNSGKKMKRNKLLFLLK